MTPKRPLSSEDSDQATKKPRHGFRVGPENLPDGPWRRKVTKKKHELIHNAKVKKNYAKVKAREQKAAGTANDGQDGGQDRAVDDQPEGAEQIHPTRQLMLKDEEMAQAGALPEDEGDENTHTTGGEGGGRQSDGLRRRTRRPGYYDKQLQRAEQRRTEAEERAAEAQRRREERAVKLAERDRYKRAMAKTRGRDGKKKLGRESTLLLDKVKKMVAKGA